MRSAEKSVMSPVEETKLKTCQLALGPLHRFQVWPAMGVAVVICEPTGWMLFASSVNASLFTGGEDVPSATAEPDHAGNAM